MDQRENPDRDPEDVLSMGEGRRPRWGLLGAVLAVFLLGLGTYQLASRPPTPPATEPAAAAAAEDATAVLTGSARSGLGSGRTAAPTTVRLGRNVVTLTGAGVTQAHRETAAVALGRVGHGWLVRLTSRACEDRTDSQVAYGTVRVAGRYTAWEVAYGTRRATGRYTAWDAADTRRPSWRSPDRSLRLVGVGSRLELRRTATGAVLDRFEPAGVPRDRRSEDR